MSEQTVTLTIPAEVYRRLEGRAQASGRSVQDEILGTLSSQIPAATLPPEIDDALVRLRFLNDDELWQAARSWLPEEDSDEIERLQRKRSRLGLNEEEERTLAGLLRLSNRIMLVRSQAAVLLHQRGHDVSVLKDAS